ncbi:hypothetical protein TWF706_002701 [Orbilia oligospora]|nr:hypothetical protein TWF706_002701 [Orbilia oligospora]
MQEARPTKYVCLHVRPASFLAALLRTVSVLYYDQLSTLTRAQLFAGKPKHRQVEAGLVLKYCIYNRAWNGPGLRSSFVRCGLSSQVSIVFMLRGYQCSEGEGIFLEAPAKAGWGRK